MITEYFVLCRDEVFFNGTYKQCLSFIHREYLKHPNHIDMKIAKYEEEIENVYKRRTK